ncbi:MAG TPA: DUF2059 domain-containing protein [Chthoniobacteraceae bacterium]|jgi:hypothetical protein|nr:DUF2059 domain-containing protein [Chthoniobacteraceae bacterium]
MFSISSFRSRALCLAVLPFLLSATMPMARAADSKDADDTRTELASEVLELAYSPSNLRDSFEGFLKPALDAMTREGMPEAARKEVRTAFTQWFDEEVKWGEIKPKLVQIYAHDFTEEELRTLLAFLQKPLGQKVMEKLPLVMGDGALAGHDYFMSKKESLIAKIQPIFDKYSKLDGGPKLQP